MEVKTYIDRIIDFSWNYGPKILTAVLLLVIGLWIIRRLSSGFQEFLKARKVDESLRPFFSSLIDVALKVALLLVVAGQLGIETTSFIAVFSAIAFAVGLALQGSLGNFASGVLILLFRPYKVGDTLKVAGHSGRVVEIQIFNTILVTPQSKKIIIPNGKMTEGAIENIEEHEKVQVEIGLLVTSATPVDLLRVAVEKAAAQCAHVDHKAPAEVHISGLSRDDMKVMFSCWTIGAHYDETMHDFFEALHQTFHNAGIELAKERRKELV